jgi:Ni,Fe-hydrogenase III small subunit
VIPVDVAVSGCPPAPIRILAGILTAISAPRGPSAASEQAAHG